jgi:hypothetical protein
MSSALVERLAARYPGIRVDISGGERAADGFDILNITFKARTAAQFVRAGLVDEATLERLRANCQDSRHAEVHDEFGDRLFLFEIEDHDAELTHQYLFFWLRGVRDVAEPYHAPRRGLHGVGAERTFRRLWRRIARPVRR